MVTSSDYRTTHDFLPEKRMEASYMWFCTRMMRNPMDEKVLRKMVKDELRIRKKDS